MVKLHAMLIDADIGNDPGFLRELAQTLESAGYDGLLTNDHVIGGRPDRQRPGEKVHTHDVPSHEPLVFLAFVAGVTTTLQLGTAIVISPQRQTVLLAKQAAELDLLSGGRLRLGVGIGRNWMEYEALNETFSNRGRRLEEQIAVMRGLWTDELVTYDGEWHQLDRMGLNPMPVQRPIPIWMGSYVGAIVDKVLDRTGRLADGWMPQYPPGPDLTAAIERLQKSSVAAGRSADAVAIECGIRVRSGDDPERWIEAAQAYRAHGATGLRISTAGGGYSTPAEHLGAWVAAIEALRPALTSGATP